MSASVVTFVVRLAELLVVTGSVVVLVMVAESATDGNVLGTTMIVTVAIEFAGTVPSMAVTVAPTEPFAAAKSGSGPCDAPAET